MNRGCSGEMSRGAAGGGGKERAGVHIVGLQNASQKMENECMQKCFSVSAGGFRSANFQPQIFNRLCTHHRESSRPETAGHIADLSRREQIASDRRYTYTIVGSHWPLLLSSNGLLSPHTSPLPSPLPRPRSLRPSPHPASSPRQLMFTTTPVFSVPSRILSSTTNVPRRKISFSIFG